jgi:L-lysine exporter family protein LysE/ArgO
VTTVQLLTSALAGLGLGLALIVAIGAQNAFVLRQGIRREHVLAVVIICIASDAVLIVAGVGGAGALFTATPWLVTVARWGGALFLLSYAALAARRALHRQDPDVEGLRIAVDPLDPVGPVDPVDSGRFEGQEATSLHPASPTTSGAGDHVRTSTLAIDAPAAVAPEPSRLVTVVGTALALTWLNPHVYLDTVVLLGSVGSSHGAARWAFASGAVLGSTLWFSALGLAARALAPVFARPHAWRVLDGVIAVVMTCIAAGLLLGG